MSNVPKRVLLVGAGRRVRNNYLPVLACMRDSFKVVGLHSQSGVRRNPLAKQWNIESYDTLDSAPLDTIDVVAISIPTTANGEVLKALLPHAARLTVVIDTPVARTLRELAATIPIFHKFKRIVIAEDYMNFPRYALMRDAVAEGLIGQPSSMTLNNVGYAFHGLALIRSLIDFRPVRSAKRLRIGANSYSMVYGFHGFFGSVIGPYRGDTAGGAVLSGDAGTITEFPRDVINDGGCKTWLLQPVLNGGEVSGFAIDAGNRSLEIDLPMLAEMRAMDFPDKSALNLERGCGLAEVFRSIDTPQTINAGYSLDEALYDSFTTKLAGRGKLPFDPLTLTGGSYLPVLMRYAALRHG